jgi:hypothetical protein
MLEVSPPVKLRLVRRLQRYVFNPPIKLLFRSGVVPPGYALLETVGRRSGLPRQTPVGDGLIGDTFWIVAEHGLSAAYVRNLQAEPRVRVQSVEGGGPSGERASHTFLLTTTRGSASVSSPSRA